MEKIRPGSCQLLLFQQLLVSRGPDTAEPHQQDEGDDQGDEDPDDDRYEPGLACPTMQVGLQYFFFLQFFKKMSSTA